MAAVAVWMAVAGLCKAGMDGGYGAYTGMGPSYGGGYGVGGGIGGVNYGIGGGGGYGWGYPGAFAPSFTAFNARFFAAQLAEQERRLRQLEFLHTHHEEDDKTKLRETDLLNKARFQNHQANQQAAVNSFGGF